MRRAAQQQRSHGPAAARAPWRAGALVARFPSPLPRPVFSAAAPARRETPAAAAARVRAATPGATSPPGPPDPSQPPLPPSVPDATRDGYRAAAVGAAISIFAALADHDAVDAHPRAAMSVVFALGMAGVTLEELWGFSKAGVALLMAASLWTIRATTPGVDAAMAQEETAGALASTSDLIFFLLAAMTVVEVVDAHGGFDGLAAALRPVPAAPVPAGSAGRRRADGEKEEEEEEEAGRAAAAAAPAALMQGRRGLAAAVAGATFFMSALLDNLTTTIVVLSVVNRALTDEKAAVAPDSEGGGGAGAAGAAGAENPTTTMTTTTSLASLRLLLGGLVVIAANAGGAWTVIGDVTTTLLWVQGHLSPWATSRDLLLPSLACAGVPLLLLAATAPELRGPVLPAPPAAPPSSSSPSAAVALSVQDSDDDGAPPSSTQPPPPPAAPAPPRSRRGGLVLCVGVGALLFAPAFREATHLPASFGALSGLAALWIVTDALHWGEDRGYPRVKEALGRVDVEGVLFFAGVLLSVGALNAAGVLSALADFLRATVPGGDWGLAAAIGVASAAVDNVPLVAATASMFGGGADPRTVVEGAAAAAAAAAAVPIDAPLWQLTALCAGTGGSMLVIGSASGIALMSLMPGATFGWFLRRVAPAAAAGYASGLAVYGLQQWAAGAAAATGGGAGGALLP